MKANSETGHAMNVANFREAISIVTAYGTVYNPSNDAIKLPGLQTSSPMLKGALGRSVQLFRHTALPLPTARPLSTL